MTFKTGELLPPDYWGSPPQVLVITVSPFGKIYQHTSEAFKGDEHLKTMAQGLAKGEEKSKNLVAGNIRLHWHRPREKLCQDRFDVAENWTTRRGLQNAVPLPKLLLVSKVS